MQRSFHWLRGVRLILLTLLFTGFFLMGGAFTARTQAATLNGFVKKGNYTFYYENGVRHKGWLTLKGKKYYFSRSTGRMATGWLKDSSGRKRYFNRKTGVMRTGWVKFSAGRRYFKANGAMKTGWLKLGTDRYYLDKSTGLAVSGFYTIGGKIRYFYSGTNSMARGWVTNDDGEKRYFETSTASSKDGVMATKFKTIDGNTYYFYASSGKMATGWVSNADNEKFYFGEDGIMVTGQATIDGVTYLFDDTGVCLGEATEADGNGETNAGTGAAAVSTGTKTIKNYLIGAIVPVGQVLYVWGGGWNDSTRKGLSPTWKTFYNQMSSSYDYHSYNDLSATNRAKGFDCSGFVGWATYQVMHTKSNVGSGYTVVSGDVGSYYKSLGWGSTINQNYLSGKNYLLKPGDIGYNDGHVWIVIGQCADKSVVIVHSTPNAGCQIAGTSTPTGTSNSQAVALAKKYMARYPGVSKYEYHYSAGNYIPRYNYFRWNRDTLADPDGYMNMTADQILLDLFGY